MHRAVATAVSTAHHTHLRSQDFDADHVAQIVLVLLLLHLQLRAHGRGHMERSSLESLARSARNCSFSTLSDPLASLCCRSANVSDSYCSDRRTVMPRALSPGGVPQTARKASKVDLQVQDAKTFGQHGDIGPSAGT